MTTPRKDSYQRVLAGFYRDPDPAVAADALAFALEEDELQKDQTILLMFARMPEVYPEVHARFRQMLTPELDENRKRIIQMLLDPPDEVKGARYLPTTPANPQDLDLCWGEFLVTGSLEVVKRIIAVLDGKDLVRSLIDESLLAPDAAAIRLTDAQWHSFHELGILIGTSEAMPHPHVGVPGDVDLLIWWGLQKKHEASVLLVRQLSQDHVLHLATKGAALWSLRSNAEQHPSVKGLCDAEAAVAGGAGRRCLA